MHDHEQFENQREAFERLVGFESSGYKKAVVSGEQSGRRSHRYPDVSSSLGSLSVRITSIVMSKNRHEDLNEKASPGTGSYYCHVYLRHGRGKMNHVKHFKTKNVAPEKTPMLLSSLTCLRWKEEDETVFVFPTQVSSFEDTTVCVDVYQIQKHDARGHFMIGRHRQKGRKVATATVPVSRVLPIHDDHNENDGYDGNVQIMEKDMALTSATTTTKTVAVYRSIYINIYILYHVGFHIRIHVTHFMTCTGDRTIPC